MYEQHHILPSKSLLIIARIYEIQDQFQQALENTLAFLDINPSPPIYNIHIFLGQIYAKLKKWDLAKSTLIPLIYTQPYHKKVLTLLIKIYKQQQWEPLLLSLYMLIKSDPHDPMIMETVNKLIKNEQAQPKSISIDSNRLLIRGFLLSLRGKYKLSLKNFDTLLAKDPNHPEALLFRAIV